MTRSPNGSSRSRRIGSGAALMASTAASDLATPCRSALDQTTLAIAMKMPAKTAAMPR